MDEYWQIIAPKTFKYFDCQRGLESMLFGSDNLLKHLIVPEMPANMRTFWRPNRRKLPLLEDVGLIILPLEILNHIITLLDVEDMICLGATNSGYWNIARKHIYKHYSTAIGQLARQPLVCVGDRVVKNDYPPGVYTPDEIARLDALQVRSEDGDAMIPFRLSDISHPDVGLPVWSTDLESDTKLLFRRCRARGAFPNDSAFDQLISQIVVNETWFYALDQEWILRNLTTKEIVLADKLTNRSKISGPLTMGIGFREALVWRICWSSLPCQGMKTDISRGIWAGHSFDIVSVSQHLREVGDQTHFWKDASDDVARDMENLLETEYGPNWRAVCE